MSTSALIVRTDTDPPSWTHDHRSRKPVANGSATPGSGRLSADRVASSRRKQGGCWIRFTPPAQCAETSAGTNGASGPRWSVRCALGDRPPPVVDLSSGHVHPHPSGARYERHLPTALHVFSRDCGRHRGRSDLRAIRRSSSWSRGASAPLVGSPVVGRRRARSTGSVAGGPVARAGWRPEVRSPGDGPQQTRSQAEPIGTNRRGRGCRESDDPRSRVGDPHPGRI